MGAFQNKLRVGHFNKILCLEIIYFLYRCSDACKNYTKGEESNVEKRPKMLRSRHLTTLITRSCARIIIPYLSETWRPPNESTRPIKKARDL